MKNILIIGAAKSGKSTLANMLCKEHSYNKIPLDYFTSSFKHNFPELGISSNVVIENTTSKKLCTLLSRVISIMNFTSENYIIDSAHIYPEDIIPYIDKDKWSIIVLGYPNITPQKKLEEIRKYETDEDWTFKRSNAELLDMLSSLISISKTMKEQCDKLDISFIDTSNGDLNKLLKKFIHLHS